MGILCVTFIMTGPLLLVLFLIIAVTSKSFYDCPSDGIHPDPDNCQCFYDCANMTPFNECCGPGTFFDANYLICNYESMVNCGDRPHPGSTRPPTSTSTTTTTARTTATSTTTTTTTTTVTTTSTETTTTTTTVQTSTTSLPVYAGSCGGVTLGDCLVQEHHIENVNTLSPGACQETCQMIDECKFFSHNGTHCHYLAEDYQQDCRIIGGPMTADLVECLLQDPASCDRVLQEECSYTQRLEFLEPSSGEILSASDCLTYCKSNTDLIQYCVFHASSGECRMFASTDFSCQGLGGYQGPPLINQC